jgi:mannose-1-phosphate guanylyltransferase
MDYAVIMAGGTGKRLWPLSRQKRPKQVLELLDGQTLLRRCFERLKPIFDIRNIIVLTNAGYSDVVRENLSELPANNVIAEPAVRDTAGAIGLVSTILKKYDPDASIAVVTADQIIEPADALQQALTDALAYVNNNPDDMITFGIQPTFASTGLGYIKCVDGEKVPNCRNEVYTVEAFKEKPDVKTAQQYLDTGQYFWNSGMFVWKARTILANLTRFLPEAAEPLAKIQADWDSPSQQQTLKEWFVKLPKISIDFAVMEKAERVKAIKLDCRWLDMGSFAALADIISSDENNNVVVAGQSELFDCKNSN